MAVHGLALRRTALRTLRPYLILGTLQAFVVALVLHLVHAPMHEGHEMSPVLHWLRLSALAAPLSIIVLAVGTALARRLVVRLELEPEGRLGVTSRTAWALVSALAYALATVPAGEAYKRLFEPGHHEHMSWLAHASRDGSAVLGTSFLLLLVATILLGAPWSPARVRLPRPRLAPVALRRVASGAGVAAILTSSILPAQSLTSSIAQAATTAAPVRCSDANAARTYDVAAINVAIPYNRWGDVDPNGQMFVLQGDKEAVLHWSDPLGATASDRRIRPRPLVLRANEGECVKVTLTNELDDKQWGGTLINPRVGMRVQGPSYDVQTSDGSAVGFNEDTTVPNKDDPATSRKDNQVTYYWLAPEEGIYVIRDQGALGGSEADGGSIAHGLYGSFVVEPAGSTWTDPVSGALLYTGTTGQSGDLYQEAIITPPSGPVFREGIELSQDEIPGVGFGFNYGAEPQHNREANKCPDCVGEETSLSSWAYGDPALVKLASGPGPWLPSYDGGNPEDCGLSGSCWTSNVLHSYPNDPYKLRYAHAGVKETHVFHFHAHTWLVEPKDSGTAGTSPSATNMPESQTIDSQTYGPGEAWTADLLFGAGSKPGTVGDSIFHCHLYSHFAEGFWALFRVHDVLEDGTNKTPDGIKVRKVLPLPDRAAKPKATADNPGYPRFIPGESGWRAPQPPGGVFETDPATGALKAAMRVVAGKALDPAKVAVEQGVQKLNYNGATPKAGAPLRDPCPAGARQVTYNVSAIQTDVVYNEAGWHDTQARILVPDKDVEAILAGTKVSEPLFFRANAGDCVNFNLTNRLPNSFGNDAFQKLVQTNMIGQHIHLVKFDVLGSDGSSNGWNYQQAAYSKEQADFNKRTAAGTEPCDRASGCRLPENTTYDPTTETTAANLGQTISERWYADYELNTVYTHDHHFAAITQNRGVYGALIIEAKGLDTRNPRTGAYYQPINDSAHGTVCGSSCEGTAYGARVDIIGPGTNDDFREFSLAIADFVSLTKKGGDPRLRSDTINPPPEPEEFPSEDPGVMAINYRNAPLKLRETLNGARVDPAYAFSSYVWGDPKTPMLELYDHDAVQFRLIQGSQEEQHVFGVNGMRWRKEPDDPESPLVSTQAIGISEAFNLRSPEMTCASSSRWQECNGDFLYGGQATDDLYTGMWGLMRMHGDLQSSLLPLPDNEVGDRYSSWEKPPAVTGAPPEKAEGPGDACPSGWDTSTPTRKYNVVAFQTRLKYNNTGDHDPYGLVYALASDEAAIKDGTKKAEPLVLRANEGDCVEVTLTNKLTTNLQAHKGVADRDPLLPTEDPAGTAPGLRVGMTPQLVRSDVRGSDGATVGFNLDQTVGPGETITYRWYADDVTPGELGAINLLDFGDVRGHRHHGLFAGLHIEPVGATYHNPYTGAEITSGAVADIHVGNQPDFREFTSFFQDGLNLRDKAGATIQDPAHAEGLDAEDQGEKGFNYTSEPFRHRVGMEPVEATAANPLEGSKLASVFSSHVHGDPDTPIFRAYAGDPVRMRVLQGGDKPRQHAFELAGHAWKTDPHDPGSSLKGNSGGISVGRGLNLHLVSAGGTGAHTGDYRYGCAVLGHHTSGGLWGILRVYPASTSTSPTPIGAKDDPRAGGHPIMPLETAPDTTAPTVSAAPMGGIYNTAQSVTLAASEPATIYYTKDGTSPTTSSAKYDVAFDITVSTTLKFMAIDGAGNQSATSSQTYTIDTTAPVAKPPVQSFTVGSQLGTTSVPVKLAWSATDTGTGVARYQLQQSNDGGATYSDVALPTATTTSITRSLEPSTTKYAFRVRAYDKAGNASAWATGPTFEVAAVQEGGTGVGYMGTWTTASLTGAYGGYVRYASASGTKSTFTFTGHNVAWVSTRNTNRGKAEVWVDGVKVTTVDLYASSSQLRRVVFAKSWSTSGSHTLEVRVLGDKSWSSGGTRVDVDAFSVLR